MSEGEVYGAVLAGGVGRRMGEGEKPKQYLYVGDRPILIHTLERFLEVAEFRRVIVLCPESWLSYTEEQIGEYLPEETCKRVAVIAGGETRNETIMRAIDHIESEGTLDEKTILVTHDAARPFVTGRILKENIRLAEKTGACSTVIPATDTIAVSEDGATITQIPERSRMYTVQTPQTFLAKKLKRLYESLTEEEKATLTDAATIFVINGERVSIVEGEVSNIKITYPYDLKVAEALLGGE